MLRSVWMVYVPVILPMISKEVGKAFMSEMMSWAASVVGGIALCSCEWVILLLSCEGVIFKAGLGCVCCFALYGLASKV